jgi:L-phenylalanine/L-methionine N-acetyltransferase
MTITVRRVTTKDAAALAKLMSDPAVFSGLLQMPYPTEERWVAHLAGTGAADKADLALVAELHGEVVASAGLFSTGPALRRRHVMGLGISVAQAAQGQGVGTALMAALCDYADRWLNTLRIELTVYTDNEVALRLYQRFGFEIEGTLKGYAMRDGVYVDAHAMARFHPSPAQIVASAPGR